MTPGTSSAWELRRAYLAWDGIATSDPAWAGSALDEMIEVIDADPRSQGTNDQLRGIVSDLLGVQISALDSATGRRLTDRVIVAIAQGRDGRHREARASRA